MERGREGVKKGRVRTGEEKEEGGGEGGREGEGREGGWKG